MTATDRLEREDGRSPEREGRTAGPLLSTALLRAAQAAEEDAFAQLYRACYRPVLAMCIATLPHAAANDAEDCAQDAWMSAGWLRQFDPARGPLIAWLRRLARRRCYDRLRHGRRNAKTPRATFVPLDLEADGRRDPSPDPFEQARLHESEARILAAVRTLPGKRAQAVRLCFFHELTMKEAGARLGVTESRVSQAVSDSMRMLRRRLEVLK